MSLPNRLACCALSCLLWAGAACAADACPALPDGSSLRWERRDLPDFTFCKAIDARDDGAELAVTIGASSPFRPRGALAGDAGAIDGRRIRWYRAENGFRPGELLRETLVRLGRGQVAHISVRARDEERLAATIRVAESLRFAPR